MTAFFIGGLLPFSCIFIQLFFIFNSIWGAQFYYMFGFLFLVFIMLVITISETSILMCYFQLCGEVGFLFISPLIIQYFCFFLGRIYIYIYRTSIFCGVLASSSFWEFSIDGVPKNFSSRSPKLRNLRKHFIESSLNRIFAVTHKNTEPRTTGLIRYLRMLLLYLVWFRKFLVVQCQVQYYKRPRFSLHKLTLE